MSSSEPYSIVNPKHNNRDLLVFHYDARGSKRQLAHVRPGETCQPGKQMVWVEERPRPARLLATPDGTLVPDTKHKANMKLAKGGGQPRGGLQNSG